MPRASAQLLLHEQYLTKLEIPTAEKMATIASVQEERERQIDEKYHRAKGGDADEEKNAEENAAGAIQVRNKMLAGMRIVSKTDRSTC